MMAENVGPHTVTATVSDDSGAVSAGNSSRAVARTDRPVALIGVTISGRDRTIRRMVVELYRENPHLPSASRGIVSDYCKVVRAAERVYQRWQGKGFEPGRDADLFMKATAEARHHATVLGLTPVSMASLGVDLGRLRRLGDGGDDPLPEADLQALERRVLDRLPPRAAEVTDTDDPPPFGGVGQGESFLSSSAALPDPAPTPHSEDDPEDPGEERVKQRAKRLKDQAKADPKPWERQF